jgi:hypothetical protein
MLKRKRDHFSEEIQKAVIDARIKYRVKRGIRVIITVDESTDEDVDEDVDEDIELVITPKTIHDESPEQTMNDNTEPYISPLLEHPTYPFDNTEPYISPLLEHPTYPFDNTEPYISPLLEHPTYPFDNTERPEIPREPRVPSITYFPSLVKQNRINTGSFSTDTRPNDGFKRHRKRKNLIKETSRKSVK